MLTILGIVLMGAELAATEYRLHSRLGYKVSRLARVMEARLEAEIGELGVTRIMWCVLSGVGLENVRTPSALADYIGVARPTVSRVLRDMERQGLISRNGALSDGRAVEIELTGDGSSILQRCRPIVDALNRHFAAKLSEADLHVVLNRLDRLSEGESRELTVL